MQDVVSGETVTYAYDSLNRLIQARGTGDPSGNWSQQFTYDGFANLTQKSGSNAPTNAFLSVNPLTNRLNAGGAGYDSNGNLTNYGSGSFAVAYSYDVENRLSTSVAAGAAAQTVFGYDPGNQRVYQGTYNTSGASYSSEQLYFYGADGKKLVAYASASDPLQNLLLYTGYGFPTSSGSRPYLTVAAWDDTHPRQPTLTQKLRSKLQSRLTTFASSHCAQVIGNAVKSLYHVAWNASGFVNGASAVNYYDATTSDGQLTENQVSGNGNRATLAQALGGSDAVTIINGKTPVALIGSRFDRLQNNSVFAGNVLLHEYLHSFFGLGDSQLYAMFKASGLTPYNSINTESISSWLSTDCQSTPAYSTWQKQSGQ